MFEYLNRYLPSSDDDGNGEIGDALHAAVKDAIDAGRLEVLDGPHTGTRAYWMVAPTPQWRTKKVRTLVEFLSAEL